MCRILPVLALLVERMKKRRGEASGPEQAGEAVNERLFTVLPGPGEVDHPIRKNRSEEMGP